MQLTQEPKKVIRSGQFQESKFKIEASAKAFGILSSKLYSDQYRAIVRELCTNASDAHAAAGIKDPITVCSPTSMNPTFSVQDSGNGIDPTEFEKIYTTYFYSTKTDTNNEVGCFGLGSKSPFAYTQQFSVENCFKGIKYIYTCYINENGEPSVTLLTQSPTNSKGVKVSFPVKRENFYEFEKAVLSVLQWFDITPNCNLAITNNSFSENVKKFPYGSLASSYNVRMGQVLYPVDSQYFRDFLPENSVVNVNIGDLDITPSRESLEYRQKTISKLKEINDELGKKFRSDVSEIMQRDDLSDFGKFQAIHKYHKNSGYGPSALMNAISTHFPKCSHTEVFCPVDKSKFKDELFIAIRNTWKKGLDTITYSLRLENDTIIFIKDKVSLANKKIIQLLNDNKGYRVLVVPSHHKDEFMKEYNLFNNDVVYASKYDLRKEDGEVVKAVSNNCCKLTRDWVRGSYGYKKSGAKLTKDDKDGMYITEKFCDTILNVATSYDKNKFIELYEKEGSPELYIFTETQYNQLKIGQKNFKNFLDVLLERTKAEKDNAVEVIAAYIVAGSIDHSRCMELGSKSKTNSLFKQYKDYHDSLNIKADDNLSAYYEGVLEVLKWHDREFYNSVRDEVNKKVDELTSLQNLAKEKYPLVKIALDNSQWSGIIDSVVEYVDLVESK